MIVEVNLGVVNHTEGYVIWNLMRKTELLETWVEEFTQLIESVNNELKVIDARGSFESDDETGTVFTALKGVIDEIIVKYTIDENKDE